MGPGMPQQGGKAFGTSLGGGRIKSAVLKRLAKYLIKFKWTVLLAFVLVTAANLLGLVGPMLSGAAINAISYGKGNVDFDVVFYNAGLMVGFYILSSILAYIVARIMISLGQKIVYSMRKDLFEHLVGLPVGYFDRRQTGDVISNITYDIDTINTTLSHDLLQIGAGSITVIGSFVLMMYLSPVLMSVFVLTLPITYFFSKYRVKKVRPLFRARAGKLGALNGFAEEMLSGHKTIKAYNREEVIIDRFATQNEDTAESYYLADYHGSIIGPSMNFINNLSLSLIILLGAGLYLYGKIELGDVAAFLLLSRRFSGPINEFANILSELQSASAAAERVFNVLDTPLEKPDTVNAEVLTDVLGQVDFENVKFGYVPDKTVLHDFSLNVKPGSLIAIVGPTGAGKTTIINLLMRFYDPDSGAIMIDGHKICDVTRESLRKSFTMVLQDTWLFHGTIFDNIAYGIEDAKFEDVKAAAKGAMIHEYIMQMPRGYDTLLSDEADNISKGQKQLIAIARAMLPKSNMLILDEATSNVDSRTEIRIQKAMYKLMENKTSFVIAHRLSTIQNADLILVIKEGNVVESGTHDSLMNDKGEYFKLFTSQFET